MWRKLVGGEIRSLRERVGLGGRRLFMEKSLRLEVNLLRAEGFSAGKDGLDRTLKESLVSSVKRAGAFAGCSCTMTECVLTESAWRQYLYHSHRPGTI